MKKNNPPITKPVLICVVAVAGIPDKEGNVFSLEDLKKIADENPTHFWLKDNSLLTNQPIKST